MTITMSIQATRLINLVSIHFYNYFCFHLKCEDGHNVKVNDVIKKSSLLKMTNCIYSTTQYDI